MEKERPIAPAYYDLQSALNLMMYYNMVDDYSKVAELRHLVDKTISIISAQNILELHLK